MIEPTRRKFITGLSALIVAPAIVRVESLMPVRAVPIIITREAIELFTKTNKFLAELDSQYADRFANGGYKVGSQFRIRLPIN